MQAQELVDMKRKKAVFCFGPDDLKRIEAAAKKRDVSRSQVVREAIRGAVL